MISLTNRSHAVTAARPPALVRYIPTLYQVGLVAVLGAVLLVALAPRLDTDLWWHLKVGAYIASRHVVPAHDFMSYTLVGHAWTDHEWFAELGLYGLYRLAGLWGPVVFFALVICATFALLYAQMSVRRVNPVLALFLVSAGFVASSASWGPRIQMMTLFFLAAYMLVIARFDRWRSRRALALFPLLMLLWTNVHGGFVLGLAVLAITAGGEWLNAKTGHPDAWSGDDIRAFAIALAAAAAVTVVNPNGLRQLLYPLTFVLPNPFTNLIQESASPNFHMPVIVLFEGLLLLLLAAAFIGRARVNWTHMFMVVAFTHLALSQVRNVAVWAVVITPLVAHYTQQAVATLREEVPAISYRRRPVRSTLASILNLALLFLVTVAYIGEGTHFINAAAMTQAERENYPRGAIQYMRAHPLPAHVFVSYGWGGYLLWNLFPTYRDYMDSRADTLYTSRILSGYVTAFAAAPGWRDVLRRYAVGTVLIEPSAPLAQVLSEDRAWKRVYGDGTAVVFVHHGTRW